MSEQREDVRSEDWSGQVNEKYSHDSDRVDFSGDGLDTGVKVLGWCTR